jgi:DNA (cytosine-5)-methyltransferase 1
LHRTDFRGGYSARSLDTSATAPFFKQHFPRYANKESAFLTLATREKIKWNLTDGKNLKIRDKAVKNSFLQIFEAVQSGAGKPFDCLVYIFVKLKNLSLAEDEIFGDDTAFDECTNIVT